MQPTESIQEIDIGGSEITGTNTTDNRRQQQNNRPSIRTEAPHGISTLQAQIWRITNLGRFSLHESSEIFQRLYLSLIVTDIFRKAAEATKTPVKPLRFRPLLLSHRFPLGLRGPRTFPRLPLVHSRL